MDKQYKVFSSFTKRKVLFAALLLLGLLLISGCGVQGGVIDHSTPGLFNHYIIYPLSTIIQYIAGLFANNYGFAIIIITLLIRLALMPLMMKQYRSQSVMKQKMALMQPELKQVQEKYKDRKDDAAKQELAQETMQLYQQHKVNPLAIGCLPMLIQLPILTGLYYAIRLTPELANHSFLWFRLGEPDFLLPIAAALVYFIQFKVSQKGNESAQQKQMAFIGYLSPILMGVFALSAPAAISLYWVTGGLFMIAQSYLASRLYSSSSTKE